MDKRLALVLKTILINQIMTANFLEEFVLKSGVEMSEDASKMLKTQDISTRKALKLLSAAIVEGV